jgi:two-component system C4-dicarboxylate transport sensor histidine kinase DctB
MRKTIVVKQCVDDIDLTCKGGFPHMAIDIVRKSTHGMNSVASFPIASSGGRRRMAWCALLYAMALALVVWGGDRWADGQAQGQARRAAQIAADSRASLLISELQKYRLLPIVLAEQPEVAEALSAPGAAADGRLDRKLEGIAGQLGNSIVYLLDAHGRAIAASNWRLPSSFVGQDYSFRPYFGRAMRHGADEFFGLGTVSRQSGLFLSRRVAGGTGVIVVKFVFDTVERGWGPPPGIVFVTGPDGVVLLSNRPDWRFGTTHALPPGQIAEMRRTRQYGTATLAPLPFRPIGTDMAAIGTSRYAVGHTAIPIPGWTLTALEPLAPIRSAYLATARLVMMAAAVLMLIPIALWLRARGNAELALAMRQMLEAEVTARTAELEATQLRFREAREALAHANRLGSIGQITAAVAHEINQPVATIRTLAENGVAFLHRQDPATAEANLSSIAALTARIGTITAELRGYARRGTETVRPVSLDQAIDGTLLLVGHVLRSAGVAVERDPADRISVMADPIRLEQILVNLLHNAIEALADRPSPRIGLLVEDGADVVRILIADTGAGISDAVRDTLFAPFATSKPTGLGLGLGIARDIAREFGGELDLCGAPAGWTTAFLLTLRRA